MGLICILKIQQYFNQVAFTADYLYWRNLEIGVSCFTIFYIKINFFLIDTM